MTVWLIGNDSTIDVDLLLFEGRKVAILWSKGHWIWISFGVEDVEEVVGDDWGTSWERQWVHKVWPHDNFRGTRLIVADEAVDVNDWKGFKHIEQMAILW